MTRREALELLGLGAEADEAAIKKRYRRMMATVHPDALSHLNAQKPAEAPESPKVQKSPEAQGNSAQSGLTAALLNEAREVLLKTDGTEPDDAGGSGTGTRSEAGGGRTGKGTSAQENAFRAPVNENAYRARRIFHQVTDPDGEPIGSFTVARGKFMWTREEEFPLFLRSLCACSAELLDEADDRLGRRVSEEARMPYLGELTLFLAGQYVDACTMLPDLSQVTEDGDGRKTYRLKAALEELPRGPVPEGERLQPLPMRGHRLRIADRNGIERGFLSFADDRLYYIVIPLLEQKRVQIRVTAGKTARARRRAYQELEVDLRFPEEEYAAPPENLNLAIEALLRKYEKDI